MPPAKKAAKKVAKKPGQKPAPKKPAKATAPKRPVAKPPKKSVTAGKGSKRDAKAHTSSSAKRPPAPVKKSAPSPMRSTRSAKPAKPAKAAGPLKPAKDVKASKPDVRKAPPAPPPKKVPPLESLDFKKVEAILEHPHGAGAFDAMLQERMKAWNQRDKSTDWSIRRAEGAQWQLCFRGTAFRRLTLKGQHVISRDIALGGEPGGREHTWSTEIGKRINVATLKGVIERMLF